MAYKDEYEVARLLLREGADPEIRKQFAGGARVYWHLHPPFLRALGMKRKLKLGRWARPALLLLRSLETLSPSTSDAATQIAELPDLVRGYESIKLRNVARFREQAAALEAEARQRARTLPLSAGRAQV